MKKDKKKRLQKTQGRGEIFKTDLENISQHYTDKKQPAIISSPFSLCYTLLPYDNLQ